MMADQREGQTWLSLRESWQRAALTEREPLKRVQGGAKRAHPRLACRVGKLCAAHPLTPSRAQTMVESVPSLAREGE